MARKYEKANPVGIMIRFYDPDQTVLFPDLFEDIQLPSITTLPDFDRALENFVHLSDFGAFIDLSFSGLEKSCSFKLAELQIPRRYLGKISARVSPVLNLFPLSIRNELNRFKYDTRAFFTKNNSIKTALGYFLFRNYFHKWDRHKKKITTQINAYLEKEIGDRQYADYFLNICREGQDWLFSPLKKRNPYTRLNLNLDEIRLQREKLSGLEITYSQLDRMDPEFVGNFLVLKTLHISETLQKYREGISITSSFKTIHLEYLTKMEIDTVDDIKELFASIEK